MSLLWVHFDAVSLSGRHLVPLTDLKPVNPVPAWNVAAPSRKGDLGEFCASVLVISVVKLNNRDAP